MNIEIFGLHRYIADICRRLGKLGYLAIAPEIYSRFVDYEKIGTSLDAARAAAATTADGPVEFERQAGVA